MRVWKDDTFVILNEVKPAPVRAGDPARRGERPEAGPKGIREVPMRSFACPLGRLRMTVTKPFSTLSNSKLTKAESCVRMMLIRALLLI